jgi:hypothetical protein
MPPACGAILALRRAAKDGSSFAQAGKRKPARQPIVTILPIS